MTVTFSGYLPATETFTVAAGEIAARDINLTSAAAAGPATKDGKVQLAAFTVSSEREGNATHVRRAWAVLVSRASGESPCGLGLGVQTEGFVDRSNRFVGLSWVDGHRDLNLGSSD